MTEQTKLSSVGEERGSEEKKIRTLSALLPQNHSFEHPEFQALRSASGNHTTLDESKAYLVDSSFATDSFNNEYRPVLFAEQKSLSSRSSNTAMTSTMKHDRSTIELGPSSPASLQRAASQPITEQLLIKQPPARPITEQQLVNEVKGIYAGLVMVEKKCVEIVGQHNDVATRLSDQQWKALVALHRTLLQEHHDFFSASQHPSSSDALKKLATKYAMPARMWRHGIHAFLELLRHRLPKSQEYMLSFIYLAYSMMALLEESVPNFTETWIECLGDLARHGMAIEDTDPRGRGVWSKVAEMWYNEAADKSQSVGRIQHHLAILARPKIMDQLFYYGKALVSSVPWQSYQRLTSSLSDSFTGPIEHLRQNRNSVSNLSQNASSFFNIRFGDNEWYIPRFQEWQPGPFFSRVARKVQRISSSYARMGILLSLVNFAHALETVPDSHLDDATHGNGDASNLAQDILLWVMCGLLTISIPILAPKLGFKNANTTSSIAAFMFALAVSATTDQNFPNPWTASFAGASLGCSFWLARLTRSDQNTILVAFVRYLVPLMSIYNFLKASETGDGNRNSGLSPSIPCLSVFGAIGLNALVNEKMRELKEFLQYVWDRIQEYERVGAETMV